MIKVLVVEDSEVSRQFLVHILEKDLGIRVVGTAKDGEEAIAFLAREKPDVVTMDIQMPKLDGIEATRRIMASTPVPIVIVSAIWNPAQVATTFRAMEAGALALVEKPSGGDNPKAREGASALIQTVKNMSEIPVVTRRLNRGNLEVPPILHTAAASDAIPKSRRIVAIGASTGGPLALRDLLGLLPPDFASPILIVQHIAAGFLPGLAEWLSGAGRKVEIAQHGQAPLPGCAYLAPDGFQMGLDHSGAIMLTLDPPENGLRPSVSYLFRSVAEVYGARAVGIVLTGMGRDGAAELKFMRERGAITVAQDLESSIVHGMPGAAVCLDAAMHILPPSQIAILLAKIARSESP